MSLIKNLLFQSISFFLFISCNDKSNQTRNPNEVTTLLQVALKTAFYHGNLPGIESLIKNDSVVITSDSSYLSFIPSNINGVNFKVVNQNLVCSLFNKDSSKSNYLYIRTIEKKDSSYYISIENLSCEQLGGGGSIGIYLSKSNDSFIVKSHTSSSIN